MHKALQEVRARIGRADEELVHALADLPAGRTEAEWRAAAERCAAARKRVELGLAVAETKYRLAPDVFGPLARAQDRAGLNRAITDDATERTVLDRARARALKVGDALLAARVEAFYRDRIIPETKRVQIERLCAMG